MKSGKHIVVFSGEEERLIAAALAALEEDGESGKDIASINQTRSALNELARSISLYPSILERHDLGSSARSVESLIGSLCRKDMPDMILRIPTKAILGRGFSIAKVNFFMMIRYIVIEKALPGVKRDELARIISACVSGLTAEEVYISLMEDTGVPMHVRTNAAYLLAHIWEFRVSRGVPEFDPILRSVWQARDRLILHFGTMMGFAELFRLSGYLEQAWFEFLERESLSEDEVYSLEEFIFGLTFEEIVDVRRKMNSLGRISVEKAEVMELLGKNLSFPEYGSDDPRELYRSYRDRKVHSRFRARASIMGPKKTLEEYLMCFLLTLPEKARVETGA